VPPYCKAQPHHRHHLQINSWEESQVLFLFKYLQLSYLQASIQGNIQNISTEKIVTGKKALPLRLPRTYAHFLPEFTPQLGLICPQHNQTLN
jgi:hypothetical protein